ncbi:MAG: DUF1080 domain-containing protein [Bacteroidota bacterium]
MKHSIFSVGFFVLISVILIACDSPAGPVVLFEEGDPDWTSAGDADWSFSGSELIAEIDSGASFAITKTVFDNFELTVEFFPDSTINSGVFLRCKGQMISDTSCYELNISDYHPMPQNRSGSIVNRAGPAATVSTIGQWNQYRVRAEGSNIRVWLNGVQTAELTDDQIAQGHVGLQALGKGVIRFRNAKLQKL